MLREMDGWSWRGEMIAVVRRWQDRKPCLLTEEEGSEVRSRKWERAHGRKGGSVETTRRIAFP